MANSTIKFIMQAATSLLLMALPGNWMIRGFGKRGACSVLSDLGWVNAVPISGTVGSMLDNSVAVTFDSAGLAPGIYAGSLCLSTSDSKSPLVTIPLTMRVVSTTTHAVFLPLMLK